MIAFKVLKSGDLLELTEPNGGDWGDVTVDGAFWSLLKKHYGDEVIDEFATKESSDYLEMQRQFELKKRSISTSKTKGTRIKLLRSLAKIYKKVCGVKLNNDMIGPEDGISYNKDKLELSHKVSLSFFQKPKEKLIDFLEKRYCVDGNRYELDTIVMVGEFSESEEMKEEVKAVFTKMDIKVIVPKEASLTTVKGAVLYGHNHMAIRERILPCIYGISIRVPFDETIHPTKKRIWCSNRQTHVAEDVFQPFIRAGTPVIPGETFAEHRYRALYQGINNAIIEVYRTDDPNPRFLTDQNCFEKAKLELEIPDLQYVGSKLIDIKISFGVNEVTVEAKEHDSDNRIKSELNFLI